VATCVLQAGPAVPHLADPRNHYALDDQRRLGGYLLAVGGGLLAWLAWKLLWGRFETFSRDRPELGRAYRRTVQMRYCRMPSHVASIGGDHGRHPTRREDAAMAQRIELGNAVTRPGAAAGV